MQPLTPPLARLLPALQLLRTQDGLSLALVPQIGQMFTCLDCRGYDP